VVFVDVSGAAAGAGAADEIRSVKFLALSSQEDALEEAGAVVTFVKLLPAVPLAGSSASAAAAAASAAAAAAADGVTPSTSSSSAVTVVVGSSSGRTYLWTVDARAAAAAAAAKAPSAAGTCAAASSGTCGAAQQGSSEAVSYDAVIEDGPAGAEAVAVAVVPGASSYAVVRYCRVVLPLSVLLPLILPVR
jgi:hypothetical protein